MLAITKSNTFIQIVHFSNECRQIPIKLSSFPNISLQYPLNYHFLIFSLQSEKFPEKGHFLASENTGENLM